MLSVACLNVQAGIITLDFEDQTGNFVFNNLTTQGFRLSPSNYYSIVPPQFDPNCCSQNPSNWIGWSDARGAFPFGGPNPFYLGSPSEAGGQSLWIDYNGESFSALGLDPASIVNNPRLRFTSSEGGDVTSIGTAHVDFSGPQWSNVSWILIDNLISGDTISGFDNFQLSVADSPQGLPEPGTVWLIGLAGLMFVALRHKKRVQT